MISTDILIFGYVTVLIGFSAWIGLRLTKRLGFKVGSRAPMLRKIGIGLLMTGAIAVGVSIGNGGIPKEPLAIYVGFMLWLLAMFILFRRAKSRN